MITLMKNCFDISQFWNKEKISKHVTYILLWIGISGWNIRPNVFCYMQANCWCQCICVDVYETYISTKNIHGQNYLLMKCTCRQNTCVNKMVSAKLPVDEVIVNKLNATKYFIDMIVRNKFCSSFLINENILERRNVPLELPPTHITIWQQVYNLSMYICMSAVKFQRKIFIVSARRLSPTDKFLRERIKMKNTLLLLLEKMRSQWLHL